MFKNAMNNSATITQRSTPSDSLSALLQPNYTPTSASDFIGSAHTAALVIDKLIAQRALNSYSIKLSLSGPPGVGKSALCKYFAYRLGCRPYEILKYAGKDVDLERVRQFAQEIQYAPSGPYRCYWIDEADCMTPDALKRMLPMLDELRSRNAFILTANTDLSKIEERFHTRFKTLPITGPTASEIADFLLPYLGPTPSPLAVHQLKEIADNCEGNVRSAIDDLDTYLLTQ
jgi:DNA polymerase III delta prime subunit